MKKTHNVFWIISACFLAVAALWGSISPLSLVMASGTVCGIAMIVFGVISVLAFFTSGTGSNGRGWLLFDGIFSFIIGLSFLFGYVDASLFTVDLVVVMALWLMLMGMSQIARYSHASKSWGRFFAKATGVLSVVGGLSLFVRPFSDFLLISQAMRLCAYASTFLLLLSAVMIISRCLSSK